MEYEKSGITSEDLKRYAALVKDPSTVTVMGSENLGDGVETGSTGERDMHSDATSVKHSAPYNEGRKEDGSRSGGGSGMVSDLKPTTENSYGGGLYGTDSTPSSSAKESGHASTSRVLKVWNPTCLTEQESTNPLLLAIMPLTSRAFPIYSEYSIQP